MQATLLKIIPFKWKAKERLLLPLSGKAAIPSLIILILIWINLFYLSISLYYTRQGSKVSASSKSIHVLLLVSAWISAIFGYNNFKRRKYIANFMNSFLTFQNKLEDEFMERGHVSKANACEFMLHAFVFMPYPQSFLTTIMFIQNSKAPRYFYSQISSYLPASFFFVFALMEYGLYICYWFTVLLNVVLMFTYWFGSAYWLKEMRCSKEGEKGTLETDAGLRKVDVSLFIYSCMSLINKRFREAMSPIILPWTQFFIILIPSCANYILIRFHDELNFPPMGAILSLSISCCLICVLAFPFAAYLHSYSRSYLYALKQPHIARGLNQFQKKVIKADKPLKVHVGILTFIRAFTVLKLINSIIYWTMRSLLIF